MGRTKLEERRQLMDAFMYRVPDIVWDKWMKDHHVKILHAKNDKERCGGGNQYECHSSDGTK